MSRVKDEGPYAVGNVYIQKFAQNSTDAVEKWRGKHKAAKGVHCLYPGRKKAWLARAGKCDIGYFETEELAVFARNEWLAKNPLINPLLGVGRGWTFVKKCRARPYRMQCGPVHCHFATQAEAEAAYKKAVEARRIDLIDNAHSFLPR